jgi:5-bromo-4-chloroindolyl phosphate hydrolysis protein
MSVKADTVRAMNEAYARLSLKPARVEEIPIELNQLRSAIEAVNRRVDFDVDPFDFRVALLETAERTKR